MIYPNKDPTWKIAISLYVLSEENPWLTQVYKFRELLCPINNILTSPGILLPHGAASPTLGCLFTNRYSWGLCLCTLFSSLSTPSQVSSFIPLALHATHLLISRRLLSSPHFSARLQTHTATMGQICLDICYLKIHMFNMEFGFCPSNLLSLPFFPFGKCHQHLPSC